MEKKFSTQTRSRGQVNEFMMMILFENIYSGQMDRKSEFRIAQLISTLKLLYNYQAQESGGKLITL